MNAIRLVLLLCSLVPACTGASASDIGGACKSSAQCQNTTCVTGSAIFSYGICTVPCKSDGDCPPGGTTCVNGGKQTGGVCTIACSQSEACKSGYICTETDHLPSGSVFACNLP